MYPIWRGTGGPAIQRPSAVSAVGSLNLLLSNGLHRRLKMRFSAVAAPSCAVLRRESCFDVPVMAVFGIDSRGGRSGSAHPPQMTVNRGDFVPVLRSLSAATMDQIDDCPKVALVSRESASRCQSSALVVDRPVGVRTRYE